MDDEEIFTFGGGIILDGVLFEGNRSAGAEIGHMVIRAGGEKCACVLQDQDLGLTQSGLSYHMKILCESGLVESRQEGKWTHYRLSESGRRRALALLEELTAPGTEAGQSCCGR